MGYVFWDDICSDCDEKENCEKIAYGNVGECEKVRNSTNKDEGVQVLKQIANVAIESVRESMKCMQPNRFYKKTDDDNSGNLCLIMEQDGDIIITIDNHEKKPLSLQFCSSGGNSFHTRKALKELALAIEKDL